MLSIHDDATIKGLGTVLCCFPHFGGEVIHHKKQAKCHEKPVMIGLEIDGKGVHYSETAYLRLLV